MAKILLVEDDSNLREIYGARLEAEGYKIISAGDGEEALAVAVKEKPDLIISDVMMPKISGFDMLDILRATPETKDVKVIMMTALSQDEDRQRGESLGADRYFVKSQVMLDDLVASVKELLADAPSDSTPNPATIAVATGSPLGDSTDNGTQDETTTPDATQTVDSADGDTVDEIVDKPNVTEQKDVSTATPANLENEVADFVATSPLMNGTSPQPKQSPENNDAPPAPTNPA